MMPYDVVSVPANIRKYASCASSAAVALRAHPGVASAERYGVPKPSGHLLWRAARGSGCRAATVHNEGTLVRHQRRAVLLLFKEAVVHAQNGTALPPECLRVVEGGLDLGVQALLDGLPRLD